MSLQRHWQSVTWLVCVLWPISMLFRLLVFGRRVLFQLGIFRRYYSPLPVIVVGNITVGGTGKTPLIIGIAQHLQANGYKPGVVSRGYGGAVGDVAHLVGEDDNAAQVGDEPVLIANRTGAPVAVCRERHLAVELLLQSTEVDVVLSDDGLQHYTLARDLEIVSVDAERGFGNGFMLPAGPMREPASRLASVDYVISKHKSARYADYFSLQAQHLVSLSDADVAVELEHFTGKPVHAVAGIGNPDNFFELLRASGLLVTGHAFPDHHQYSPSELEFADARPIIMTEKDAVKCRGFSLSNAWYLTVAAEFHTDVLQRIEASLKTVMEKKRKCDDRRAAI